MTNADSIEPCCPNFWKTHNNARAQEAITEQGIGLPYQVLQKPRGTTPVILTYKTTLALQDMESLSNEVTLWDNGIHRLLRAYPGVHYHYRILEHSELLSYTVEAELKKQMEKGTCGTRADRGWETDRVPDRTIKQQARDHERELARQFAADDPQRIPTILLDFRVSTNSSSNSNSNDATATIPILTLVKQLSDLAAAGAAPLLPRGSWAFELPAPGDARSATALRNAWFKRHLVDYEWAYVLVSYGHDPIYMDKKGHVLAEEQVDDELRKEKEREFENIAEVCSLTRECGGGGWGEWCAASASLS
ncbi:hypothetical protein BDW74DRAFT_183022 [Aspergillus multicolor]|uniref:uncharacterized protein n=1 Tax=Aspergillus multicolor TaxID=41759 RepID=UPI003CCC95B0